jgi:hypothetical protein
LSSHTPKDWAPGTISMGQVWDGGVWGTAIQKTLSTFQGGAYTDALDSFFTYNYGDSSFTRTALLMPQSLQTGKIPQLAAAAQAAGMTTPTLVLYSNDFSTSEAPVSNQDIRGVIHEDPHTHQPVFDYSIPINQFANLGLQAGAFQHFAKGGSILFNPDAIGGMTKNFVANKISINDIADADPAAIYVTDGTFAGKSVERTKIDYSEILNKAVDLLWTHRNDYKDVVDFPDERPDPGKLSNGIAPIAFAGDITDYLAAQAWMIKQFAPKMTLSTIFNLWAGNDPVASTIKGATYDLAAAVDRTAAALTTLGWDKAVPYMDFITFDKYERDETSRLVLSGKAYDFPRVAWERALEFYDALTTKVMPEDKQAIMLWQIPAAGLPSNDPSDAAMLAQGGSDGGFSTPHFGLTESFFFGDPELAKSGIAKSIFDLPTNEPRGKTYGEVLTSDPAWAPAKGMIDPATGDYDPVLDKVFAILWGGGETSTPISYRGTQWKSIDDPTVQPVDAFNVKNTDGTVALDILKHFAAFKDHFGEDVTPPGEPNVLKEADLKATTAMVIKTSSPGPVSITLNDNGRDDVSLGYFEIDARTLAVAAPGNGNALAPGDAGYAAAALQIATAHGLIADPGYLRSGDFQLTLDPAKAYGFLIVNRGDVFTSIAAANFDGLSHVAASGSIAQTDTVSFEDRPNGGDQDCNDLVLKIVGAHFEHFIV